MKGPILQIQKLFIFFFHFTLFCLLFFSFNNRTIFCFFLVNWITNTWLRFHLFKETIFFRSLFLNFLPIMIGIILKCRKREYKNIFSSKEETFLFKALKEQNNGISGSLRLLSNFKRKKRRKKLLHEPINILTEMKQLKIFWKDILWFYAFHFASIFPAFSSFFFFQIEIFHNLLSSHRFSRLVMASIKKNGNAFLIVQRKLALCIYFVILFNFKISRVKPLHPIWISSNWFQKHI